MEVIAKLNIFILNIPHVKITLVLPNERGKAIEYEEIAIITYNGGPRFDIGCAIWDKLLQGSG